MNLPNLGALPAKPPAEPATRDAGDHRGDDIGAGEGRFARLNELQCLRAESGKGREPAENADSKELARGRSETRIRERDDEADDCGANYVHEKSAPREWTGDASREQCGEPMSRDTAEPAAQRNQQIHFHARFLDRSGKIA